MDLFSEMRKVVREFNLRDEIAKIDLTKSIDYKHELKENNKFRALMNLATLKVYNPSRALFSPRKSAAGYGWDMGMNIAYKRSSILLKDGMKYDWKIEVIRDELAKIIEREYELLKKEQEIYDARKIKSIQNEMTYTSEIYYLISFWKTLLYTNEQLKKDLEEKE